MDESTDQRFSVNHGMAKEAIVGHHKHHNFDRQADFCGWEQP